MAIQVNGTTVIDNSRQLTNIASIDSTTASAFTAAGVGGGSAEWNNLSNVYSYTYTSSHPNGHDTGMLNISTILSGLPSDWKYLAIIEDSVLNNTHNSYYYAGNMDPQFTMRLGSSSSSYSQIQGYFEMSQNMNYYPPNTAYSNQATILRKYGFLVLDKTGPTSIFQASTFGNPSVGGMRWYSNRYATTDPDTKILPNVNSGYTPVGWCGEQISQGQYGSASGSFTGTSYLGWRVDGGGYSSQDGVAPNISVNLRAAYIS